MYVVDLESLSTADLKTVGAGNYAQHPSTFISVFGWHDLTTGETFSLVHPELSSQVACEDAIRSFQSFLGSKSTIVAHNAGFEKSMINSNLADFAKLFGISIEFEFNKYIDTQTLSNIFRSPASLQNASKFFNLSAIKDSKGASIMKRICSGAVDKPRSTKTTVLKIPAQWKLVNGAWYKCGNEIYNIMEEYCRADVDATAALFCHLSSSKKLEELGDFKKDTLEGVAMTKAMNQRGVLLDKPWLSRLKDLKNELSKKSIKHSMNYFGLLPTQSVKLKQHINSLGYALEGMGKPAIIKSFNENSGHEELKDNLTKFMNMNKRSLSKIDAAEGSVDSDGVLRGMFKFCGAYATGRFTSFGVQLQNLPRPKISLDECKKMIADDSLEYDADSIVSGLRGAFIPRPGNKFFIADLKQIELRRVMDKAGYPEKVQYLVNGGDLYSDLASKFFDKKVTKEDEERQVGKAFLLALGYGMGRGKFVEQYEAATGKKITKEEAEIFINKYKQEYSKVVMLWDKYEQNMRNALHKGIDFKVKLSSGRYLNYGKLQRRTFENDGYSRDQVVYFNGIVYKALYGSMIFQQVIQAECRDILLIKLNALHKKGAKIVMTVHDEVIVEVSENKTLDELTEAWYNAGEERVKELFPGMIIESDCVLTDRYWSH